MTDGKEGYGTVLALTREEWRAWLEEHHATSRGIWLISYKKASGKSAVGYAESVEEALCFGWIDSHKKTLADERAIQLFTPRRRKSPWSKSNKERIERLIAEGKMTPAGLAKIEEAQRDGSWEIYDAVETLTMPADLAAALAANPAAEATFRAFSPSQTKQLLWHVESAKRPETRAKRIAGIVAAAAEGRNALDWQANRQRQGAETD
jgi:uncharacterized protein YdeI (YjbR/CyaY-like superfamily)